MVGAEISREILAISRVIAARIHMIGLLKLEMGLFANKNRGKNEERWSYVGQ